jgi:acetyltransferase-like isoleucine patch superfamily enzyme
MDAIIDRIRRYFFARHLQASGVSFVSAPRISGMSPDLIIRGRFSLGKECIFHTHRIKIHIAVMPNGILDIGDGCFFNDGTGIYASTHVTIGPFAKVGDRASIVDSTFHEVSPSIPPKVAPITIGKNVWLGSDSLVLPGVSIGDHTVVAAGAIVTKSIPDRCVAAGMPAKVIRRFECPEDWIRS